MGGEHFGRVGIKTLGMTRRFQTRLLLDEPLMQHRYGIFLHLFSIYNNHVSKQMSALNPCSNQGGLMRL